MMAKICDVCPLCRFARKNPDTRLGKLLFWHGKWCPFWKAWEEKYQKQKIKFKGDAHDSLKNSSF